MKPFSPRHPEPTRGLRHSLRGRIRARKYASDTGLHTDSGPDMGTSGHARHSSLPGQSEESSDHGSDKEEHEEEEVSDKMSCTNSRWKI